MPGVMHLPNMLYPTELFTPRLIIRQWRPSDLEPFAAMNADAEVMIVASGTAVSQGREAIRLLEDEGVRCGLEKVKSLRPWPGEEIREATKNAKHIFVPEFNVTGWLAKEIKATIPNSERVYAGPHVCGGMTMPPEIIVSEIKTALGLRSESLAGRGS